jgi:calcineurin-like phosphoesterase family protein
MMEKILNECGPMSGDLQLFFLGDLVNKGPNSVKVVNFVRMLSQTGRAVVIRGNHDEALLEEYYTSNYVWKFWNWITKSQYFYLNVSRREFYQKN